MWGTRDSRKPEAGRIWQGSSQYRVLRIFGIRHVRGSQHTEAQLEMVCFLLKLPLLMQRG